MACPIFFFLDEVWLNSRNAVSHLEITLVCITQITSYPERFSSWFIQISSANAEQCSEILHNKLSTQALQCIPLFSTICNSVELWGH
jgi:hypothetical protein